MEVHILDFYQEIYQQNLKVEFYEFLRMEKKFDNIHELIEQIQSDIRQAKEYFQIYSL
jgi:riboflavin kinase/FMN adenylyltransferase